MIQKNVKQYLDILGEKKEKRNESPRKEIETFPTRDKFTVLKNLNIQTHRAEICKN